MYRTDEKIFAFGETLFRVKYEDGHKGGWFSSKTNLPSDSVTTDENTFVLAGCILEGNIDISASQVGPDVTISTKTNKKTVIKESKIKKTKLILNSENANILDSKIQNSKFSLVALNVRQSEIENVSAGKDISFKSAFMFVENSIISAKVIVKYDNSGSLTIKNTNILGTGSVSFNIERDADVCIEYSKFKDDAEKNIILRFHMSYTKISKTIFGNNCHLIAQGKCNIFESEILGNCWVINGEITKSKIYGTFKSCANPVLTNCYIAKDACFDDTRANIKKTTITDTNLLNNSKIIAEPTEISSKETTFLKILANPEKIPSREITILESVFSGSATAVCKQRLKLSRTTVKDDAKIQDCSLNHCKITNNAKVAMVNMFDCFVQGDASIGFSCNGNIIKSSMIAKFYYESFLSKDSVIFLDINMDDMATAFVKNRIRVFFVDNKKGYSYYDVNIKEDIEMLEQLVPGAGHKKIMFLEAENKPDCIDYFLKTSKISKDLLNSEYSELTISSIMLYYYAVSLYDVAFKAKDKQKAIENKTFGWYYAYESNVLKEAKSLAEELDSFCFVDIRKQTIKFKTTNIIIPESLLGLYRKKPKGNGYKILKAKDR